MIWLHILVFVVSCFVLAISGKWMVSALARIAKFLGWREFTVAFIFIAFGTSIPNLFIGISSAFHKIPQLSLGDVLGGNVVDLTLALALVVFIAKGLSVESKIVQSSSFFTIGVALLPLVLILDGNLSRADGLILLMAFFLYIRWLFAKKERFAKIYDSATEQESIPFRAARNLKSIFKNIGKLTAGLLLLLLSSEIIVRLAVIFSQKLDVSPAFIGLLIIGLGNCLPEIQFSIAAIRAGQTWMALGNLMGSVIIISTLVLGTVALITPIQITDFSPFAVARFFLLLIALFFLIFIRTDRKITRKEAFFLLSLYAAFVIAEILLK